MTETMTEKAAWPTRETPCVATWEANGYDDSDFYGVFWLDGRWQSLSTATTRGAGGMMPAVNADAETVARYAEWRDARVEEFVAEVAAERRKMIGKGSRVRVQRPRSKQHGREGEVFWYGDDRFNPWYGAKRAGIDPDDGGERFFVPADYLEIEVDGEWIEPVWTETAETVFSLWQRAYPPAGSGWR